MYLLKYFIVFTIFISCKPSGPVTPEDSFIEIKKAYADDNIEIFLTLLSKESLIKINEARNKISDMDENSRKGFASYYGLKPDALKNISTADLIKIQFIFMKANKTDLHKALTSEAVSKIIRNETSAEIMMSNGITMKFIREYPYWKMDLTFF
ncbi:MAG: hypothetical protein JW982_00230 [Spirochaetes bacterium]|nr:hypothetical protein [Spirochaetota bacterium]